MRNLTPILRSGYPPCAAVSLVVLSPTREGRVCDIQLVIIAMVLSTTPIFSKGTVIFRALAQGDFCSSLLHSANSGERRGRRVVVLPTAAWCFTRVSGSDARLLGIFDRRAGGERVERAGGGRDGRTGTEGKLEKLHPGELESAQRSGNVPRMAPLPRMLRTLLPLRSAVTISFTPDGPPPALVCSVIKCH